MKKVLLFNPPSAPFGYSRDYFCSKALKTDYVEHPVDLLFLSGILSRRFRVTLLDATVLHLDPEDCTRRIRDFSPDAVIFLSGSVSWSDDFNFMEQTKKRFPHLNIIGIGDIFFDKNTIVNHGWIDAVLLDFTSEDILDYLEGRYERLRNMYYRKNQKVVFADRTKPHNQAFTIPVPRHELFLKGKYTFPFARKLPFATLLTDFGCTSACPFCLYNTLGFKQRTLENVFEELAYVHSLGIRELFVKDQSFAHDRQRALRLCAEMIRRDWRFSWTAFSRADSLDAELVSTMKGAGCHTLIVGVETANEDLLKKFKPGLTLEKINRALELCKKIRIRTVGTFCLGLPSETKESVLRTIDYAVRSGCDFASFNVFVPKAGTVLEKEFLSRHEDKKLIDWEWDQSGMSTISGNGIITEQEMADLLARAIRAFYFRAGYVLRRALTLTSMTDLSMFLRSGLSLFARSRASGGARSKARARLGDSSPAVQG